MPMRESATVNSFLCGKRRVATYGPHNQIFLVRKLCFHELLINALLREKSPLRRIFFLLFSLSFDSTVAKYAARFRSARSHACYDRGYDNENSYISQMRCGDWCRKRVIIARWLNSSHQIQKKRSESRFQNKLA